MTSTPRLIGNRLLVRVDKPPAESKGGIVFVHPEVASPMATGEVLAVGYLTTKGAGEKTAIPGLGVGDRVLFSVIHKRVDANPQLQARLEDDVVCIRPADVLLTFAEEDLSRIR